MFWSLQIVDPAEIEKLVDKVLSENPKQLEQYRGGKTKLQGFFAGQVWKVLQLLLFWPLFHVNKIDSEHYRYLQAMKLSKGKANPGLLNKILLEKLNAKI